MLLLIVLPAGLAVAAAALCWRNQRRWRHIQARPLMTCQQAAGLPPGQFVVQTGQTSDGPLMKSPHTGRECVGYRAMESWYRAMESWYRGPQRPGPGGRGRP